MTDNISYRYVAVNAGGADEANLGTRSQQLEVGLMGAMTAAVLRRALGGEDLDDHDFEVIDDTFRMLTISADAIEFLSSRGLKGKYPTTHSFAAVELTAEVISAVKPSIGSDAQSYDADATRLRSLATQLGCIRRKIDSESISKLLPTFSALANVSTYATEFSEELHTS